ncbi:MAG: lipopolysaccharide biosynthesis protein [Solirubrobacterales bacterium]|nr:lipopolysaccharide biosynthesis protein [Solirubrobacterales bacterium]
MGPHRESIGIARNALTSYGARGLLAISVLLLTPYLFRGLGPGGFGTWSVIFSLTAVALLLQIGFSQGIIKIVAELRAQRRDVELQAALGAGTWLMAAAGVFVLVVAVLAMFTLTGLAADDQREAFRAGVLFMGAALAIRLPCMAYAAALVGHQRYDLANIGAVTTTVVFALGAVIAVESGAGVAGVAGAQAAALIAGSAAYAVALRRLAPELSLRPRPGERDARKTILRFSAFTLIADGMVLAGQRLDVVAIAALAGAVVAGPYAAVVKLQSGVQALTRPFIDLLMPMVSDLGARGERSEILRRLSLTTRLALQITLPAAAVLAVFSTDAIDLWLGAGAPQSTATIVIVLMVVNVIAVFTSPATEALIGLGRVRLIAGLAVGEGALNVALTLVLVATHGAIGAAIGTLTASALFAPLRLPLVIRATGGSAARFAREALVVPLASSAPAIASILAVFALMDPGWERLLLGTVAGLGLGLAVALAQIGPTRVRDALRVRRMRPVTS